MPLLIVAGILVLLSGPIALCICIAMSGRLTKLERRLNTPQTRTPVTPKPVVPFTVSQTKPVPIKPAVMQKAAPRPPVVKIPLAETAKAKKDSSTLEQRIGTKWILIAGVIATIFSVGFFLKYAYDNFVIGELGRVVAAIVLGFIALIAGEITRRRDYGIVAKAVTALGFAILYAAVFGAFGLYGLIGSSTALTISVVITAAALVYAFALDEVVIAFISLLGGFLAPVLIVLEQNITMPLFSYVLVLGVGAMACAYRRKWRSINMLAFAGTFIVYTSWFVKYYWPDVRMGELSPVQMPIAVGAVVVFFALYLLMPILFEIVNKAKARKEDVLLVLANSMISLFYFWQILHYGHPMTFAYYVIGLSAAHVGLMFVVAYRCKDDKDLRAMLMSIGLALMLVAMPLFTGMYVLSLVWAVEGVMLAMIGIRYRSIITQVFGVGGLLASCVNLLLQLPLQGGEFRFIANPAFGSWCFVAVAACVLHILYRLTKKIPEETKTYISQLFYSLFCVLIFIAASMEWYCNCRYNIGSTSMYYLLKGQTVICALTLLLLILRPLCPSGAVCKTFAWLMACVGSVITVAALFTLHVGDFRLVANAEFASVISVIAVLIVYYLILRGTQKKESSGCIEAQLIYGLIGALLFAVSTAEWYWYCNYNMGGDIVAMTLKGVSIIFAATVLFYVIRPIRPVGIICNIMAVVFACLGSIFVTVSFLWYYGQSFTLFFNSGMLIVVVYVCTLALAAKLLHVVSDDKSRGRVFAAVLGLLAVVVLWVLLTEEIFLYWYWQGRVVDGQQNWKFLAHMYASIMWAVYGAALMVAGFWSRVRLLRYVALGLFALLLAKVFIVDTSEVESVYRIAAFLATGVTLIGVSYLYQYLKKKNFFEDILPESSAASSDNNDS